MNFVIDNYLWFVIGGIVLLMIIIGYFAEKTNFGKREFSIKEKNEVPETSNKKEKKRKKDEEVELPIEEPVYINERLEDLNSPVETIEVPLDTHPVSDDPFTFDIEQPKTDFSNIQPMDEDLNAPFGDTPVTPVAEDPNAYTDLYSGAEDLSAPLEGVIPNVVPEETNLEVELPSVPDIVEPEEDDVWKF